MFIVSLNIPELILADAYEISTDLPNEAHEDSLAAYADSEDILMGLIILVELEVCRIVCVCLYDPQVVSVKVSKLSDDLETSNFF